MRQRVAYLSLPSIVLLAVAVGGCVPGATEDDPAAGGTSGNGGTTGGIAGVGGSTGGTAGMATGGASGGMPTGGVGGALTAGMGGATAGSGGTPTGGAGGALTAGMGGATAGAGGSATGGMAGLPPGGAGGASAGSSGAGGQGAAGGGGSAGGGPIDDFVEDPGAACTVPAMPSVASLVADPKLPDPFMKMSGTRMTDRSEWICRREEILQQGYEFIYGEKPRTPKDATTGSVTNTMISVTVNDNGNSTTFSVTVSIPSSGSPPYPAVIGFGGIGFSSELASRGIASINYSAYTLGAENGGSGAKTGGFYTIYGSNHNAGLLVAWAWGVSRILDVLELHPEVIDPTKIGVTGCSRFGKGAFVVGVLDNRIALTVPVESGVGGTPALRLIGNLDASGEWPYHAISYQRWFSPEQLGDFATANNANGDTTDKLPVDMHEMIGLVAPRGLYIVDNPSTTYAGLNRNSAWVTANVGAKIYEALGVPDNITYQGASGDHCQWRTAYTAPLVANLEKFLLGDASAATGTFATDFSGPSADAHHDWTVPTLTGSL